MLQHSFKRRRTHKSCVVFPTIRNETVYSMLHNLPFLAGCLELFIEVLQQQHGANAVVEPIVSRLEIALSVGCWRYHTHKCGSVPLFCCCRVDSVGSCVAWWARIVNGRLLSPLILSLCWLSVNWVGRLAIHGNNLTLFRLFIRLVARLNESAPPLTYNLQLI